MKVIVNNSCDIPVKSEVCTPLIYPRPDAERLGVGEYDQTKHGEGDNYTDTDS